MKTAKNILIAAAFLAAASFLAAAETPDKPAAVYPSMQAAGYGRVRYTYDYTDGKISGFSIAQCRFGVTGAISEFFSYTFSMETTNTDTENRKMVYDVYIDTTIIPAFRIRAGQFKYGFGLEQTTPDADVEFVNKSDVVNNLIKPNRDIGLQVGRDVALGPVGTSLTLGLFNGSGSDIEDENNRKMIVGRLLVTPITGLTVGGSIYRGTVGAANDRKDRTGAELKYENGRLLIKSEYMTGTDKTVDKFGWYAMGGYTIGTSALLLVRYDVWNPDRHSSVNKETTRWTFGLNWFFGKNVLLRTNYELKMETPSIKNDLFMTQLQVKM